MTTASTRSATVPRYSIPEQERRFLVDPAALPPLAPDGGYLIEDLYVQQSRLRLRKMTSLESGEPVYKFCKKYPRQDPLSGPIVNIYLSMAEYELLAGLPGRRLRKRRHHVLDPASPWRVDRFEDALAGLVVGEAEHPDIDILRAMAAPAWPVREITTDPFFAGDNLATLDAAALQARLRAEFAGMTRTDGMTQ